MQEKQKVTLYLSSELYKKLRIRSAVDGEAMSDIAQRAIEFLLAHPEVVEEFAVPHGQSHRVYACPACTTPLTLRDGEMVSLSNQSGVIDDESLLLEKVQKVDKTDQQGEEELVPCL